MQRRKWLYILIFTMAFACRSGSDTNDETAAKDPAEKPTDDGEGDPLYLVEAEHMSIEYDSENGNYQVVGQPGAISRSNLEGNEPLSAVVTVHVWQVPVMDIEAIAIEEEENLVEVESGVLRASGPPADDGSFSFIFARESDDPIIVKADVASGLNEPKLVIQKSTADG